MANFPGFEIRASEFKINRNKLAKLFWAGITLAVVAPLILIPIFDTIRIDGIDNIYLKFFFIGVIAKYIFDIID